MGIFNEFGATFKFLKFKNSTKMKTSKDLYAFIASEDVLASQERLIISIEAFDEFMEMFETVERLRRSRLVRSMLSGSLPSEKVEDSISNSNSMLSFLEKRYFACEGEERGEGDTECIDKEVWDETECCLCLMKAKKAFKLLETSSGCFGKDKSLVSGDFYCDPLKKGDNLYVHYVCGLWCPQVTTDASGSLVNVPQEVRRSRNLKCSLCKRKGAVIGCSSKKCRKSFHLFCALGEGFRFDTEKYEMFCPEHCEIGVKRKQLGELSRVPKAPHATQTFTHWEQPNANSEWFASTFVDFTDENEDDIFADFPTLEIVYNSHI